MLRIPIVDLAHKLSSSSIHNSSNLEVGNPCAILKKRTESLPGSILPIPCSFVVNQIMPCLSSLISFTHQSERSAFHFLFWLYCFTVIPSASILFKPFCVPTHIQPLSSSHIAVVDELVSCEGGLEPELKKVYVFAVFDTTAK